MMKKFKDKITVFVKGILMGTCDVIPGVSGGTIAFITGIYDKLIDSLYGFNLKTLKLVFKGKFKEAWNAVNGGFLLVLFLGIVIAILTFAKIISFLLVNYPSYVRSFFFGLVISSVVVLVKSVKHGFKKSYLLRLLVGVAIGLVLTSLPFVNLGTGNVALFFSGAIAIMAMILPGISGSYILLILGQYQNVLQYILDLISRDWSALLPLIIFVLGCVIGLILFSKFLHRAKEKWYDQMVIVLTGFIIGSLQKIWPWKSEICEVFDDNGVCLSQSNILPSLSTERKSVLLCLCLAIVGFFVVWMIEKLSKKKRK